MNLKKLSLLVAVLLAFALPGVAQTTITKTTLSAAVSDTRTTLVTVASASGITASTSSAQRFILVDRELMQVRAISSTTLTVVRGYGGSTATKHASGSLVTFGPAGNYDPNTGNTNGVFLVGNRVSPIEGTPCVAGSNEYSSVFEAQTGVEHTCVGSLWRSMVANPGTQGITQIVFCGDLANNTTSYLGAAFGYPTGTFYDGTLTANDLGFSLTGTGCDALDSTTEATADTVVYANNALRVLGMVCQVGSSGSNGITLNLRASTANVTPDVSITIPTSSTTGAVWMSNPPLIAAGAPLAVRNIDTENLSASNGWCQVQVQVLP